MAIAQSVEIGFSIIGGSKNVIKRLFKGRISTFFVGSQGTGKTSFRRALQHESVEDIRKTGKSTTLETTVISYTNDVPLVVHDFGGDAQFDEIRQDNITTIKPLVILFFLDHLDTRKMMPRHLHSSQDHAKKWEWENKNRAVLSKLNEERVEEHRLQFKSLNQLLQSNQSLRNHIQLTIPIVTKYDLWHNNLIIDDFHNLFAQEVAQLGRFMKVTRFMETSVVQYHGIAEVMKKIYQESGREFKIFNWKRTWQNNK